jgi:hypothetical protein
MTYEELVRDLLAERFGPLPPTPVRHIGLPLCPAVFDVPATAPRTIAADVAEMARRGWTARQIAALLEVDESAVLRHLPPLDETQGEAA